MRTSYSFVDRIESAPGWSVDIVPGGFVYNCIESGATLEIIRVPPHENVDVTGNPGDTVTHIGSTALVEQN